MQGDLGVIDEALEELVQQVDIEVADPRAHVVAVVVQPRSAGKVDDGARQGLVQGHVGMAVARNPLFVADGFCQCLTEHDAYILHRVVCIHLQVAPWQ